MMKEARKKERKRVPKEGKSPGLDCAPASAGNKVCGA
jgi:hypothetical protein